MAKNRCETERMFTVTSGCPVESALVITKAISQEILDLATYTCIYTCVHTHTHINKFIKNLLKSKSRELEVLGRGFIVAILVSIESWNFRQD